MDSRRGRTLVNVEGDRLSNLSDDLIHKVLSYINIKEAIRTSALSSRWRFVWTSTPYLNLSDKEFHTSLKFCKFVTRFLPHRNNLIDVNSLKLDFHGTLSQKAGAIKIIDYAFSHNIQHLEVICSLKNDIELPLSLSTSRSLRHLTLIMRCDHSRGHTFTSFVKSTWELPTLTTLELHSVTLAIEEADKCTSIFSKCTNLKNLTLKQFYLRGSIDFSIIHPILSNLTIEDDCYDERVINVVAPQLKNLTIRSRNAKFRISAPDLVCLIYKFSSLKLFTDGFHSLEKADIGTSNHAQANRPELVSLLQHLYNVYFLKLNLEFVELLSSYGVHFFRRQFSQFMNLKSLKIYPDEWDRAPVRNMSNELRSYFLDIFPDITFTMISREEVKAQKIMAELRVILKKEKDDAKTNPKLNIGEDMAHFMSCWNNLGVQIQKACAVISKLQNIEDLMTTLPASNRAKIQPCFSSLCAEADIVISQITDGMKIQCDDDQSLSSVSFQMNLLKHWRRFLSKLSVPYSHEQY